MDVKNLILSVALTITLPMEMLGRKCNTRFMGEEPVRIEYGGWYWLGAYSIATGVGFMQIYNGSHWFHDVVAGAGVGIAGITVSQWDLAFKLRHYRIPIYLT